MRVSYSPYPGTSTLLKGLLLTTPTKNPLAPLSPDFSHCPVSQVIPEGPLPWPQVSSAVKTVQLPYAPGQASQNPHTEISEFTEVLS